jgi:hypothetical protein
VNTTDDLLYPPADEPFVGASGVKGELAFPALDGGGADVVVGSEDPCEEVLAPLPGVVCVAVDGSEPGLDEVDEPLPIGGGV